MEGTARPGLHVGPDAAKGANAKAGPGKAHQAGGGMAWQGAGKHQAASSAMGGGTAAAGGSNAEKGVCIICGQEKSGIAAKPDFAVRAARKLRGITGLPARHTIACREHEAEALSRRAGFEKKRREYSFGAVLFFAIMVLGSFFFGRGDLGLFIPAAIGALIVAILPFFYYFPSFGN